MTAPLFPPPEAETTPDSAFDEFYARYPRKVGKGSARRAYAKALKVTTHDSIMFGLSQQLSSMEAKDKQFIAHPATWLNGERWDDEPEQLNSMAGAGRTSTNAGTVEINAAARIRRPPTGNLF